MHSIEKDIESLQQLKIKYEDIACWAALEDARISDGPTINHHIDNDKIQNSISIAILCQRLIEKIEWFNRSFAPTP